MLNFVKTFAIVYAVSLIALSLIGVDWANKKNLDYQIAEIDRQIEKLYEKPEGMMESIKHSIKQSLHFTEAEVARLESKRIELELSQYKASDKFAQFFYNIFLNFEKALYFTLALVLLPYIWRTFAYFVLAPLVCRFADISLGGVSDKDSDSGQGNVELLQTEKAIKIFVAPQKDIVVRGESYVNGYSQKVNKDEDSKPLFSKKTKWLFDWAYPFMSFFCGLRVMTKYSNDSKDENYFIEVSSDNPDEYFAEIALNNCKDLYIVPSSIVAYSGDLKIKCYWRMFKVASWCIGQIRFYTLSGTGRVVLCGLGGLNINQARQDEVHRRKFGTLIASGKDEKLNIARTETFVPYFINKTELYDLELNGDGFFISKNTTSLGAFKGSVRSTRDAFFSAIGKFFGF